MMTRANVVRVAQLGGPEMMHLVQENLPPPGLGQVQIRHTAIGFNYIDIYQRSGIYPLELPTGLGHEAAGIVEAIGDEVSVAINDLPSEFRTIIILCDLEEFTYEEMSKILDIPIGTVRSRLHRARNMLKEKLKEYAMKRGYTI